MTRMRGRRKYKEGNRRKAMANRRTTTTRRSRRRFVKYIMCFRHIRSLISTFKWVTEALCCCAYAGSAVPTKAAVAVWRLGTSPEYCSITHLLEWA